jgi:tRNA (mo5U34)-methyltransferase
MVFQTLSLPGHTIFDAGRDRDLNEREDLLNPGWPKIAFIEHRLAGDPTNWWVANHTAVLALLRSSGLRPIGSPAEEIYLCEPAAQSGWPGAFIAEELADIFRRAKTK